MRERNEEMIDERELIKTLLQWKETGAMQKGRRFTVAIADYYGKEHQTIKAMEELAELIQALAKGDLENIKEEIADVRVMLEQIEYLYGISDEAITLRMCAKLWRQFERMYGKND